MSIAAAVHLRTSSCDDYIGLIYCNLHDVEQTKEQLFSILWEEEFSHVDDFSVATNNKDFDSQLKELIGNLINELRENEE